MKQHTIIFGGTFDPPHYGHMFAAARCLHANQDAVLWYMANKVSPFKTDCPPVSSEHRIRMLGKLLDHGRIALPSLNRAGILLDEALALDEGVSYTYPMLKTLQREYPNRKFSVLMGQDVWNEINHFQDADKLLKEFKFIIDPRTTDTFNSTLLRDYIRSGDISKALNITPPKVLDYITKFGLYGAEN